MDDLLLMVAAFTVVTAAAPPPPAELPWFTTLWTTAVGAFVGAAAAFFIDWLRRRVEEKRRRIAAGNVALLTLASMWYSLLTYETRVVRKKIIEAMGPSLPLWLAIPPALTMNDGGYSFDIAGLAFLLSSCDPQVWADLVMQQDRYFDIVRALKQRDASISRARERMDAHGVGNTKFPNSDQELADIIGPRGVGELRTMTKGMIENLYPTMVEMREVYQRLATALRQQLGEKNIRSGPLPDFAVDLKPSWQEWVKRAVELCMSRPAPGQTPLT